MVRKRWGSFAVCVGLLAVGARLEAADTASGAVKVSKSGVIAVSHVVAYLVRNSRDARKPRTEILLSDVPVDPAPLRTALDPHMAAINLKPLDDRNYVLLWVDDAGAVTMNATFSKTMTQFMNDTTEGLAVTWKTRSATRLDGHVTSKGTLKTMDGTTYVVDLTFAVDIPQVVAGTPLPAGGGDPGKALLAFLAAAKKGDWAAVKAGSSPNALEMFDKSYNSPKENATAAAQMLEAWIPKTKITITGGELKPEGAFLNVEGEMFPGMRGLSIVQMVKKGTAWQFDQAAKVGLVP